MLWRALRRAGRALWERPGPMIRANLAFSAALCLPLLGWWLAAWFQAGRPLLLALALSGAAVAWLGAGALGFLVRRILEHGDSRLSKALPEWAARRLKERLAAFAALGVAVFWSGLARSFYSAARESHWLARWGEGLSLLLLFYLLLTAFLQFGLATRAEADWRAEWKAAALMGLAFAPQAVGGLTLVLLLSGGAALLAGLDSYLGRLLWIPALMAPLFGAAWIAAFCIALGDEFLARAKGLDPPL